MRYITFILDLFNNAFLLNIYMRERIMTLRVLLQSGFEAIIGELIQHEDRYTIELLIKM